MASHYEDGRRREYKVKKALIEDGYRFVLRASSSKGSADLLMAKVGDPLWVQVGSTSKTLGPAERERICKDAYTFHARPVLAIVALRKPIAYYQVGLVKLTPWHPDIVHHGTAS